MLKDSKDDCTYYCSKQKLLYKIAVVLAGDIENKYRVQIYRENRLVHIQWWVGKDLVQLAKKTHFYRP